jgi:hypothetical protein
MSRLCPTIIVAVVAALFISGPVRAQEISLEGLPPSVVRTVPQCGDTNVDPDLKEFSVSFSKDMQDKSWSFVKISAESFPNLAGNPRYLDDKRTCVVGVTLEPDKTYAMWLNSDRFQNFKDLEKHPAVPYLLVFKTAKRK